MLGSLLHREYKNLPSFLQRDKVSKAAEVAEEQGDERERRMKKRGKIGKFLCGSQECELNQLNKKGSHPSCNSVVKTQMTQRIQIWAKDLNRCFTKEKI